MYTLPKFNCWPLKGYRNPIGKDRLQTIMAFRCELLNFGRVTDLLTIDPNFQPHSINGTGISRYMKTIKDEASM